MSKPAADEGRRIPLAAVAGAHGIKGEVRLKLFSDSAESLARYSKLFVGGQLLMDSNVSNYKGIQSYVVSLKKGIYPIDLQLIKKQGDPDMRFLVLQSKSENDRWWENQILKF